MTIAILFGTFVIALIIGIPVSAVYFSASSTHTSATSGLKFR